MSLLGRHHVSPITIGEMLDKARGSLALPFTIVRKGYAPDEVRMYFDRFDAELRREVDRLSALLNPESA